MAVGLAVAVAGDCFRLVFNLYHGQWLLDVLLCV